MSEQKPKLTLKFGAPKPPKSDSQPAAPTPASATAATPKITLKFGSSSQSAPTSTATKPAPTPKPSKSGRKPKPTAKKRTLDTAQGGDDSDSEPLAGTAKAPAPAQPPIKKLKFTTGAAKPPQQRSASGVQIVKIKHRGKVPTRPRGVGYDSEASDREEDPTIDEDFILRMVPGEDCDYLRKAIADNTLGVAREKGGADVRMRFLAKDGRRACITIRGRRYAAILVDLPCVIEAMKSWNKKEFYKSADVCQMLLVLGRCSTEEEAVAYDVRRLGRDGTRELNEKTWQWAHGITPPMKFVRKRRFRKRISVKVVEEDEAEVERLLEADKHALGGVEGVQYRHIDLDALEREQQEMEFGDGDEEEGYEDAEGDIDDGYDANGSILEAAEESALGQQEDDDDLEAHFEAEMLKQAHEGDTAAAAAAGGPLITGGLLTDSPTAATSRLDPTSSASPSAATPSFESAAAAGNTPDATQTSDTSSDDDSSSSSEDGDDDDNDGTGAADDDAALEAQQDRQRMREEIADLEAAIAREEQRLQSTPNAILKQKIARTIQGLRADLEVKGGGGGGGGEGEGEE